MGSMWSVSWNNASQKMHSTFSEANKSKLSVSIDFDWTVISRSMGDYAHGNRSRSARLNEQSVYLYIYFFFKLRKHLRPTRSQVVQNSLLRQKSIRLRWLGQKKTREIRRTTGFNSVLILVYVDAIPNSIAMDCFLANIWTQGCE